MSLKQNDTYYEQLREIQEDAARTLYIAADAALRFVQGEPLESIETEPLEALSAVVDAELQDRERRSHDQQHELLPDQPVF